MTVPSISAPVLVVGAGPVGAVTALELARHGVPSIVIERSRQLPRHPKMDYVNGRSMELLRRLGLSGPIRARGIGPDHSTDFLWTRTFAESPVHVWHHPSVSELRKQYEQRNDGTAPVEPYQRVQGSLLEEVVRDAARSHPLIDLREGWTFTGVHQTADCVLATVVDSTTNTRHTIEARYLAACDGARSTVRQCLEIPVEDAGPRTYHCSVYFRSSDPELRRHGRAFVTIASRGLTLVSRDEGETWTASLLLPSAEPLSENPMLMVQERLGTAFAVDEVLSTAQWEGSLSVAESYHQGAVFLVGDAAHQFHPTGGHGANTGLADAVDLGWKLAARINGWGGERLLDSYGAERRPVALFNREMSMNLLEVWRRFARLAAEGASREHLAGFLEQDRYQVNNMGVHFGYRYSASPVVWSESGAAPGWSWEQITPTTWPGARPPAVRLASGDQLFDRFDVGLTLVDLTTGQDGAALVRRANLRGIPMAHLALEDPAVRSVWDRPLVLVRPDQHVAWRGEQPPPDWDAVLGHVTGMATT